MYLKANKPFELGNVFICTHVCATVPQEEIDEALERHRRCDWGIELDSDERAKNDAALKNGKEVISLFVSKECGKDIYIETSGDRKTTRVFRMDTYR